MRAADAHVPQLPCAPYGPAVRSPICFRNRSVASGDSLGLVFFGVYLPIGLPWLALLGL
jgi:hypothetical protein